MRLIAALVLVWLSTLHASVTPPQDPGHLFIPMGKIYPSYSSWAVTISINMSSYRNQLNDIGMAITTLRTTARAITAAHRYPNESDPNLGAMQVAMSRLYKSISQLENEAMEIRHTFRYILSIPSSTEMQDQPQHQPYLALRRKRRGLINGIGSIMSSLFGTATENEITHLTKNVALVNSKEVAMAHAFNGTLQVLNSTRIATTENRKGLRALDQAFVVMQASETDLKSLTDYHGEYLALSLRIVTLTENVHHVTRGIQRLHSSLAALSDRLALAQVGILHSGFITVRDFGRLLRKIGKSLPSNFALPYPAEQTSDYIRIAKTKLVRTGDTYHDLFYIPLLHTLHVFDVYRFFPYQVPLHDINVSLTYIPDEPRFLVISDNRQSYIQPEDSVIETCILAKQPYCQIHEPAYSTVGAASCVVSLFRHDSDGIAAYCAPIARPTNGAPKAYYLTKGAWLIVSRPPIRLTIVCPAGSSTRSVMKAVDIISLDVECSAAGDSIFLPPYYASETHLNLPDFHPDQLITNSTDDVPIWRPHWTDAVNDTIHINLSVLPPLHVAGMPADDYFNQVTAQPLEQVNDVSPTSFSITWLLIIAVGLIGLFCLWFIIKHCCPRSRGLYNLPRYTAAPPYTPEPAIELLEPPPVTSQQPVNTQRPRVSFRPCSVPDEAVTDAVPTRGAAPLPTGATASTVFGGGSAQLPSSPMV